MITQPTGVHGRRPGLPSINRPAESSVSPSTSFIVSMHAKAFASSNPFGSGNCSRMPSTSASALSAFSSVSISSCVALAGKRFVIERIPAASVF